MRQFVYLGLPLLREKSEMLDRTRLKKAHHAAVVSRNRLRLNPPPLSKVRLWVGSPATS